MTTFRKIFPLTALIGILVVLGACSVPPASHSTTPKPLILPCADSAFALPEEVLQTGEWLGSWEAGERMRKLKWQQYGWLSVHLDLLQSEVWYGDPIPIRLTVTNETAEKPVIFVRPQWATFLPDDFPFPPSHPKRPTPRPHLDDWEAGKWPISVQIYVSMTPFPASLKPLGGRYLHIGFRPKYPQEAFSMLRPGQSCTIEWELTWDGAFSPLARPIPPGKYTLRVFLAGTALGPDRIVTIDNDKYREMLDIGGWVGCSAASNAVTLTVWPLRENIPP
jgi:hypothetical protein